MEITQEYLKSILNYCPETGVFTWCARISNRIMVGSVAGYSNSQGYWIIKVGKKKYHASRLAWLYMAGDWPKYEIDHVNLNRSDNRITNLREATRSQNNSNKPAYKNNKSGLKGVYSVKDGRNRPWRASITVAGKRFWLGSFETKEIAYAAYCKAAGKHHRDFAHY